MNDMARFGALVRDLRDEKGLTQEELGEKLGLSRPTISQLETGYRRYVPTDLVVRLAQVLGVAPTRLLAELGVSPRDAGPAQLQWLVDQLDAENTQRLIRLGYTLLQLQTEELQKAAPRAARRSR